MDGEYKIFLNNQPVGKADIKHDGLYCYYKCTCKFPDSEMFRIIAKAENEKINLGICIPKGDIWETRGRIPSKQLQVSNFRLIAESCSKDSGTFIPISTNEVFAYLDELDKCEFAVKNGQPGVVLKK